MLNEPMVLVPRVSGRDITDRLYGGSAYFRVTSRDAVVETKDLEQVAQQISSLPREFRRFGVGLRHIDEQRQGTLRPGILLLRLSVPKEGGEIRKSLFRIFSVHDDTLLVDLVWPSVSDTSEETKITDITHRMVTRDGEKHETFLDEAGHLWLRIVGTFRTRDAAFESKVLPTSKPLRQAAA